MTNSSFAETCLKRGGGQASCHKFALPGRKTRQAAVARQLPRAYLALPSRRDQAATLNRNGTGSPQSKLLPGQQMLNLLLLTVSSKTRRPALGKGVTTETAEENLDTG